MTALPVAYYLKDLSGEAGRRGGRGLGAEEASDLEFQLGGAHARGVEEGRAAARAEQEAALAAQAAAFEQKLAAERETWAAEQGVRFGEAIAAAFDDLERRVSHLVSEMLKPVLDEQVRLRAVTELSRALNAMLSKGGYARIAVSGPADLIAAIEARLGGAHAGLSFAPTDAIDIAISADDTILETQIGAWRDAIAGADQ